jgi:hypothetical protein
MTISVTCPTCGRQFSRIKPELAGKKVRCACGKSLLLPVANQPAVTNSKVPRTKQSKPDSKLNAAKKLTNPKDTPAAQELVEIKRNPFELHYSDLDQILAQPQHSDSDFDPRLPIPNKRPVSTVAFPAEAASPSTSSSVPVRSVTGSKMSRIGNDADSSEKTKQSSAGPYRMGFLFSLAMIASFTALGLAMFLLSARFASTNFIWQGTLDETIRQFYTGQFGIDPMAPGLQFSCRLLGWMVLAIAASLMLTATLQLLIAGIQLFATLPLLRWVDGMMATLAATLLFLFIGALFLHDSHTQNINRQIHQATDLAGREEPPNIQRLRAQLQSEREHFRWSIAGICAAPATIFGCSMLRLFARV